MSAKQRPLTEIDKIESGLTKKSGTVIPGRASIAAHEGNKYLRRMLSAYSTDKNFVEVDIYCVLQAFEVTCPATQHAIKKLLCAGLRTKGDRMADLVGAMAALNRAIDMEQQRMQT